MEESLTRNQEVAVVGAAFPDAPSAVAARQDLGRLGLDEDDVRTAVWTDGRFVPSDYAGQHIWRSIARSAVFGTIIGTVATTALSYLIWPGSSLLLLLIVGANFGSAVGVILGGYHGLNQKRGELWFENDWRDSTDVEGTTLLVFRPMAHLGEATQVVRKHGGRMLTGS